MLTDEPTIILSIEGTLITLTESGDGRHLIVSSKAGRLARDPIVRAMQIRKILGANLGTVSTYRAAVGLDDTEEDGGVLVTGLFAYDGRSADRLVAVIEDVLALSQAHATELRSTTRSQAQRRDVEQETLHNIIFRP